LSVDTAQRPFNTFDPSIEFWMNLQLNYDLVNAKPESDLGPIEPLGTT
jgi:plasmid maintenance system antidote protein VapI